MFNTTRHCVICQKALSDTYASGPKLVSTAQYCSRGCANRGRAFPRAICLNCDKPAARADAKYCSHECSVKYRMATAPPKTITERVCAACGSTYQVSHPSKAQKTCSAACVLERRRQRNGGANNPRFLGPVSKICPRCGTAFEHSRTKTAPRKYCTTACSRLASADQRRKEQHWRFKGDAKRDRGPNWANQAVAARDRDEYTCQKCGVTEDDSGEALSVHHIRAYRDFAGDWGSANQLNNLISLCRSCHAKVELLHDKTTRNKRALLTD